MDASDERLEVVEFQPSPGFSARKRVGQYVILAYFLSPSYDDFNVPPLALLDDICLKIQEYPKPLEFNYLLQRNSKENYKFNWDRHVAKQEQTTSSAPPKGVA